MASSRADARATVPERAPGCAPDLAVRPGEKTVPASRSGTSTRPATRSRARATSATTSRTAAPRRTPSGNGRTRGPVSSQPWLHQRGEEIRSSARCGSSPSRCRTTHGCTHASASTAPGGHPDPLCALQEAPLADARRRQSTSCTCCWTSTPANNSRLIDKIAERVQTLGGVAVGDPRHVAEITGDSAAAERGRGGAGHVSRLLEAHERSSSTLTMPRPGPSIRGTTARTTCSCPT